MTGDVAAAGSGGCHLFSGCGFPAPGLQDFNFRPLFTIGSFHFTKPMLVAILCAIAVIAFFWAAFAKPKLVPGKLQLVSGQAGDRTVGDRFDFLAAAVGDFAGLLVEQAGQIEALRHLRQ